MLHFWNVLGLSDKLVAAFTKTWISTSSCHVTNLDVRDGFLFSLRLYCLSLKYGCHQLGFEA